MKKRSLTIVICACLLLINMGCEEVFAPPPNDPLGKLDEIGPKSQELTAHIFIDATLSMEGFVIPEPTTNYIQTLKNLESPITTLFDVLYSEDEKSVTLNQGFRGHPSVGAVVLAKTLRLGEEGPWRDFYERIKIDAGAGAKIFLFGSIFGGTGAAGFPTIARLIKERLNEESIQNVKIGGALVLPYENVEGCPMFTRG